MACWSSASQRPRDAPRTQPPPTEPATGWIILLKGASTLGSRAPSICYGILDILYCQMSPDGFKALTRELGVAPMSSFAIHRRRLSEPDACLVHFAPYGFRSTYFYLTVSAGIPRTLAADPASILRAADELHEARTIWQAGINPLVQQRRELKRSGRQDLPAASRWISNGTAVICSNDPRQHPDMPLAAFIQRQIARASGTAMTGCPFCGELRAPISHSTGHGSIDRCRQCGGLIRPCQCGAAHYDEARGFAPLWLEIWHRHHMNDDGRPDDRWPGWRTHGGTYGAAATTIHKSFLVFDQRRALPGLLRVYS